MNFVLFTTLLYSIVITHIVFGQLKRIFNSNDDERKPLLHREDSGRRNSVRGISLRKILSSQRRNSLSSNKFETNSHNKASKRRSSTCNRYSGFNIVPYLSISKYSNHIYWNVWRNCDYRCFCMNNWKTYLKKVLTQINLIRLSHDVPLLKRNPLLEIFATHLANKMANENKIINDPTTRYGVSVGVILNPLASLIITKWYDERKQYYYTVGRGSHKTNDFTQLVWKNTNLVGVGASSNGSHVFLAAYYYPRGNIPHMFRENVFRRKTKLVFKKT